MTRRTIKRTYFTNRNSCWITCCIYKILNNMYISLFLFASICQVTAMSTVLCLFPTSENPTVYMYICIMVLLFKTIYIIGSLSDTYCFSHVHPLVSPVLCKRKLRIYSCLLHNDYMCIILLAGKFLFKNIFIGIWPFWTYHFGRILNIEINTSARNLYYL